LLQCGLAFTEKLNKKDFYESNSLLGKNGTAVSKLIIIDGSGFEELKNTGGSGFYSANQNGFKFELYYSL
jgi:hypothetical protein